MQVISMTTKERPERGLTQFDCTKRNHALCGINYSAMNGYQLLPPPQSKQCATIVLLLAGQRSNQQIECKRASE